MKNVWIILGAILLAVVIAAASFYGGMAYQRQQTDRVRANFFASRGIAPNATELPSGQRRAFPGGGNVNGQIKSIDGNILTLSTAQNVTTVTISDSTRILKSSLASLADLQPGQRVLINGQRDANGNLTASQILIMEAAIPEPGAVP